MPPIRLSWFSGKMTELNLSLNYPAQLSASASWEFWHFMPTEAARGVGRASREVDDDARKPSANGVQPIRLITCANGSVEPSKGPHSGLSLGACWLQTNWVVPGWDWLVSDKRDEVKEKCVRNRWASYTLWTQTTVPTSNNCLWNTRRHKAISAAYNFATGVISCLVLLFYKISAALLDWLISQKTI